MIRAGSGSSMIDEFLFKDIVAIGWNELGPIEPGIDYETLKQRFIAAYPEDSKARAAICVGQIWRFINGIKTGDKVITYDSSSREYYMGEIVSAYAYDDSATFHHIRAVKWEEGVIDRDELKTETKNTLGAILTLFELSWEIWDEFTKLHPGYISEDELDDLAEVHEKMERELEQERAEQLKQDVQARSQEFIKDLITALSWQQTEELVAGLLKSMGYKVRMTAKGPDLGSDIIASPDELGLEEPRIKVEVKKRSSDKISAPDIRNFIGGLRGHHKGIFITTTGFSKEAVYEAERANFAITLIDIDWLVGLLVNNYESLEPEIKALVPLKKIYWPA
jgi:restriction system protein